MPEKNENMTRTVKVGLPAHKGSIQAPSATDEEQQKQEETRSRSRFRSSSSSQVD
ncbi:hypothetical protein DPMN_114484 [Dreissena polymorpha]|uniref:Uncharacterized protein n=1 Tax=Dreissena polymorpha TaxID=45954 RepID=A0A9D4KK89_DREPO|nr:hypothetical protein DPMN_114484 [Dreissena polymorpha]